MSAVDVEHVERHRPARDSAGLRRELLREQVRRNLVEYPGDVDRDRPGRPELAGRAQPLELPAALGRDVVEDPEIAVDVVAAGRAKRDRGPSIQATASSARRWPLTDR